MSSTAAGSCGIRPLSVDFEDAGILASLTRLCNDMSNDYPLPTIPPWVLCNNVECVIGTELHIGCQGNDKIVEEARVLIYHFARLERHILKRVRRHNDKHRSKSQDKQPDACTTTCVVHHVCLARMLVGACCEAFASLACCNISDIGTRPRDDEMCESMARLYKDACNAATWTSAHAQFLHDIVTYGITVGAPSLHCVANESSETDLSELYAHRFSHRPCASQDSKNLLSLMTRCTNPGSRGWDSILIHALQDSNGTARICASALAISLTGMNSCVHPASRLHWKDRLGLSLHLTSMGLIKSIRSLCNSPIAFKECVRRMVSNTTSSAYASNAAFEYLEHPVALLNGLTNTLPIKGLECSASAFVEAGRKILTSNGSLSVCEAIEQAFTNCHVGVSNIQASSGDRIVLEWRPGYLGVHVAFPFCLMAASTTSDTA